MAAPDDGAAVPVDSAIAHGLEYLVRQQQPDGSFDTPDSGGPRPAVTGAALVAFLASGHTPDLGRYGLAVHNATEFLVLQATAEGTPERPDNARTVDRAWIVLALSQVDGTENDARLHAAVRAALEKSAAALLQMRETRHPNAPGGWGADARAGDDLIATTWALLALRSAQAAGVRVPRESYDRAAAYVLKCYRPDKPEKPDKHGFTNNNDPATLLPTAAAVLAMEVLDSGSLPEVKDSLKLLTDSIAADAPKLPPAALLLTTLAAFHSGEPTWPAVWKTPRDLLTSHQASDGGWTATRSPSDANASPAAYDPPGRVWPTAVNVLTLSLPYRLLPLDRR